MSNIINTSVLTNGISNYPYNSISVGSSSISNTGTFTDLKVDKAVTIKGDLFFDEDSVGVNQRLKKVEDYFGIVNPNLQLEDRWSELKKLGEEYRKLEAHLLKKEKVFAALKND